MKLKQLIAVCVTAGSIAGAMAQSNMTDPMTKAMMEVYDQEIAANPKAYEVYFRRANEYYKFNQYLRALSDIDNAIKYSDEKAYIYISAIRCNNPCNGDRNAYVMLKIQDKGIGIPADRQKHLFDKFYRVPTGNLHNVKGYGLGLYYVRTMIEQHKGTVSVESSTGKGSTFTLKIPE